MGAQEKKNGLDVTMFDNHEKTLKDSLQKWTIHKTHKGKD